MKQKFCPLVLLLVLWAPLCLQSQDISPMPDFTDDAPPPAAGEETEFNDSGFGKIAAFSHHFSTTTGIAMSPLLGMGVLGAWKYYRADDAYRNSLPWYSSPWVWGICFGFFVLLKSKDTLGAFIPEVVKKPITVLDDVSEKACALIVALAVIPPTVWKEFEQYAPTGSQGDMAMAPVLFPVLIVAGSIAVFAIVWFAFNAFSSIKILSPSSMVNSIISVVKGAIIAVFAGLAAMNPWVGIAVSLGILVFCAIIFGWSFRWNVFGTLFVKDFITGAFNKPLEKDEDLKGFSTSHFPELKSRTYGRVSREGDELVFSWKPWLFMPTQKSRINLSEVESGARKGIFLPSVTLQQADDDRQRAVVDFRLRYRSHAEEIQSRLELDCTKPNLVLGGVQASWQWIRDQVKRGGTSFAHALQS